MLEMHLRQPGFTYSVCGPFIKNKERVQKFKEKEVQDIFIKTNVIKHLLLLKIQNVIDIKKTLLQ